MEQSIALHHQLLARGTEAEFHLFPETVHSGDTHRAFQSIGQLTSDFLVQHLDGAAPPPSSSSNATTPAESAYPYCSFSASPAERDEPSSDPCPSCDRDCDGDCDSALPVWVIVVIAVLACAAAVAVLCGLLLKRQHDALRRDVDALLSLSGSCSTAKGAGASSPLHRSTGSESECAHITDSSSSKPCFRNI